MTSGPASRSPQARSAAIASGYHRGGRDGRIARSAPPPGTLPYLARRGFVAVRVEVSPRLRVRFVAGETKIREAVLADPQGSSHRAIPHLFKRNGVADLPVLLCRKAMQRPVRVPIAAMCATCPARRGGEPYLRAGRERGGGYLAHFQTGKKPLDLSTVQKLDNFHKA